MELDAQAFKDTLSRFPSGVTVVTSLLDGVPSGMTVSAFSAVSLTPPRISICVSLDAETRPAIEALGCFAVHILGREQAELGMRFAHLLPDVPVPQSMLQLVAATRSYIASGIGVYSSAASTRRRLEATCHSDRTVPLAITAAQSQLCLDNAGAYDTRRASAINPSERCPSLRRRHPKWRASRCSHPLRPSQLLRRHHQLRPTRDQRRCRQCPQLQPTCCHRLVRQSQLARHHHQFLRHHRLRKCLPQPEHHHDRRCSSPADNNAGAAKLHALLRDYGFVLVKRQTNVGPKTFGADDTARNQLRGNGEMLFYLRGNLLVRIKTNGSADRRAGQPHLTMSLMGSNKDSGGGLDLDFSNEIGKFDRYGQLRCQSPNPVPGFQASLRGGKIIANQSQVEKHLQARAQAEAWADETHFVFPDIVLEP